MPLFNIFAPPLSLRNIVPTFRVTPCICFSASKCARAQGYGNTQILQRSRIAEEDMRPSPQGLGSGTSWPAMTPLRFALHEKRGAEKSRTSRTSTTSRTRFANLSIVIRYNEAVFLISKELLKRCPTRAAALVGPA